jgi:hypothetical protein
VVQDSRIGWSAEVDDLEKQAIAAVSDGFIRDILRPRFLADIYPTDWNYVIDIRGSWAGPRYRLQQRYCSGMRIPMMPPGHTEVKASTCSDLMPPTVLR